MQITLVYNESNLFFFKKGKDSNSSVIIYITPESLNQLPKMFLIISFGLHRVIKTMNLTYNHHNVLEQIAIRYTKACPEFAG